MGQYLLSVVVATCLVVDAGLPAQAKAYQHRRRRLR